MTDNQKQAIRNMRRDGLGYKRIAQELGLPIGTVQSFCRRDSSVPSASSTIIIYDENHCRECGKPLVQRDGVKKRKFCSDECRIKWWTENPCSKNANAKSSRGVICVHCGKTFIAYGKAPRKYCCHGCYVSARFGGGRV